MNYDKIIEDFAFQYLLSNDHVSREEVIKVLNDTVKIINKNKGATPSEIVNDIIYDCIYYLNNLLNTSFTPGIVSSFKIDNININLYGGFNKPSGDSLGIDSLFDISSISKLYTTILAYKLINEGVFGLSDKIKDLDSRFSNIGDVTVSDILRFVVSFKTDGRIEDSFSRDDALEKLFDVKTISTGVEYNYNDIGLMILKEVIENITGIPYVLLFDKYITKPYGLNDTHLIVPDKKIHLVTGSANSDGSVNDLKANVLGGFSGHAGVRASSNDLIKFSDAIMSDSNLIEGVFSPNDKMMIRSNKFGSSYVNPKFFRNKMGNLVNGSELSYFGRFAPRDSFASQGSTRVISRSSKIDDITINSTILTNVSSISDEDMLKAIDYENSKRLLDNRFAKLLKYSDLVKERMYDGKLYKMHDARLLFNEDKTIGRYLYKFDNEIALKLLFLNKILKEYEHYNDKINLDIDITKFRYR